MVICPLPFCKDKDSLLAIVEFVFHLLGGSLPRAQRPVHSLCGRRSAEVSQCGSR